MAGNDWNVCKLIEMDGNGGMTENGWKWLK